MPDQAQAVQQQREFDRSEPVGTADLANRLGSKETPAAVVDGQRAPLFADNELGEFRHRWQDIQGSFVDDPRTAVRNADELVASLMTRLARVFADERDKLEHEWDKGENVSTEDLRVALQRYRSFFDRLLSV